MGDPQLLARIDDAHRRACSAEHELVQLCAEIDRTGTWRDDGARDAAHWLAMRFGVSLWKARRWIAAGKELPVLPALSDAFEAGRLGVDKVVELTRFAEPDTEAVLKFSDRTKQGRLGILRTLMIALTRA